MSSLGRLFRRVMGKGAGPREREALAESRRVLERALADEASHPVPVHPGWVESRARLRRYLVEEDFHAFLRQKDCKQMFFRTGWKEGQDHELATLESSERGRALLEGFREPEAGRPTMSPRLAHVSTNMLGMMYYVERLRRMHPSGLPRRVVEAGGGYGALSFLYAGEVPGAAYAILDLPEMLALQHYFLRLARPERPVRLVTGPEEEPAREGETTLVPASLLGRFPLRADLFVSTFALSEMPLEAQRTFEAQDYFGARTAFVAGQYAEERPEVGWVPHGAVLGAFSAAFPEVRVEKFHIGRNYLLEARR